MWTPQKNSKTSSYSSGEMNSTAYCEARPLAVRVALVLRSLDTQGMPSAAAIIDPSSGCPVAVRSMQIAVAGPSRRASAATAGESYPLDRNTLIRWP